MTHESYLEKVKYTPLERYRAIGAFQHECEFKHVIYATADEMLAGRTCAYCTKPDPKFVMDSVKASGMAVSGALYESGGEKMVVLKDALGRGRPTPVCELGNGLYHGLELRPIKGMYLYYMKIKGLYKIGVSNNPRRRLTLERDKLLGMWYYDREASARMEEAAVKEKYKEFRNKDRHILGPHNDGWTEMFTKDVLELDKDNS